VQVSKDEDPIGNIAFLLFFGSILLGIPAACGISILRYRLYDLDVVVKKTVVFGALALFISTVYLVGVFVIGSVVTDQASSTVSFAAGAAAAAAFQPLRALARRLADRVVYGKRATPYEVLSEFSDRLADTYSTDDVLPRMASLLGTSTGATEARVWLLLGGVLSPAAVWPLDLPLAPSLPMPGKELPALPGDAYPVRHQGEILGAFTLAMPGNDPMNPAKARLVEDLAAQGGLVLRNVRLLEELRASRRRIVEAQDERAKKLERDIHDGAQQQLVALTVKLRLAQGFVTKDPPKAESMLSELQDETQTALDDLRDLARGIYPPILADRGLAEALQAQARKAAVATTVEADGLGRYPAEVESAVYFCSLEALNNTAKHASATAATVRLSQEDGHLRFAVSDDGAGFEVGSGPRGSGLQGMVDRVEAVGGRLKIASAPGEGTTVSGSIPVEPGTLLTVEPSGS
jgi:signal transduction histidine kinase